MNDRTSAFLKSIREMTCFHHCVHKRSQTNIHLLNIRATSVMMHNPGHSPFQAAEQEQTCVHMANTGGQCVDSAPNPGQDFYDICKNRSKGGIYLIYIYIYTLHWFLLSALPNHNIVIRRCAGRLLERTKKTGFYTPGWKVQLCLCCATRCLLSQIIWAR